MKPRHFLIALMLCASINAFGLRSTTSAVLQLPEKPTIEQLQKVNQNMIEEVEILKEEDVQIQHQFDNLKTEVRDYQEDDTKNDYQYNILLALCFASIFIFGIIGITLFYFLSRQFFKLKNDYLELKDKLLYLKYGQNLPEIESTNDSNLFSQSLSTRDPAKAIASFTDAIRINPNNSSLYNNRGILKTRIDDKYGAIIDFNKAIALNPQNPIAYINRGHLKAELGELESALHDFSIAIDLNPNSFLASFYHGILHADLDDFDSALRDFNRTIELNPAFAEAYICRGFIFALLQKYNEAERDLSKVRVLDTHHSLSRVYRDVEEAIHSNDTENIKRCFEESRRYLANNPDKAIISSGQEDQDGEIINLPPIMTLRSNYYFED